MIFFGHLGLTLAAAGTLEKAAGNRLSNFFKRLDYRVLLLGSLLPDLTDKPVAFIFRDTFGGASRLYGHTLLFSVLLLLLGILLWNRFKISGWLTLAAGAAVHQVLDGMWQIPITFYWPLLGWTFPAVERKDYLHFLIAKLTTDPGTYIPEATGLAIIIYLTIRLHRHRQLSLFIKTGRASIAAPASRSES